MAALQMKGLLSEFIFYKDLNFRVSDSMSDFILTMFIEFSVKSYIFDIL